MQFPPILAVVLGVTGSILFMCVVLVLVVRSRRSLGHNEVKMTVYPIGKEAESPTLHAMENKAMTEFDSTEERSPDLIPDDRQSRGAKVQCYASHDTKSSALTTSTASTASGNTRIRRGSSCSNSSSLSNGESVIVDPHFNSLLQVKQPQSHTSVDPPYKLDDNIAEDSAAATVLLHEDYTHRDPIDIGMDKDLQRQSSLNYSSANVVSSPTLSGGSRAGPSVHQGDAYGFPQASAKRERLYQRTVETAATGLYEGAERASAFQEKSFTPEGTILFAQKRSSKLLEDDCSPLGLGEANKTVILGDRNNQDMRSKQLLATQSSRLSFSRSPTSTSNIFPHSRSSLTASTTENKLSSDLTGSLQRPQPPHFPTASTPFHRSQNSQSMSPPPIPTATTPPTPSTSIYHSLPRGGRFAGRGGQRNLETTPYPSNSSAFSTIVRTKSPNLGSISTRGSDACNRESSV
ncbi:hypothetical protein FHG87_006135 [Trinorchestia longiramus]|nr:hypothetical protein FHG87_006135 [Trinorchestia longiramus]